MLLDRLFAIALFAGYVAFMCWMTVAVPEFRDMPWHSRLSIVAIGGVFVGFIASGLARE